MSIFGIIGMVTFLIGMAIFLFGKQFILLRAFFGDRSMFYQLFWGTIIAIIGLAIMYFAGVFH
ncbi:hypothetical protein JZO67_003568 [Enterococcus sp. 665A]|uniref:Uncharacterized protein n=1 Tax=Candidatus Enterococcus ferrettii TaxID=2815324 RepID=A0ABV0ESG7_9ENTE|nr:hypothetical protein [Enterococcus sp. 665A]